MGSVPDRALAERIYSVVQLVPRGMVASYGDIAAVLGGACDARTVGYALNEVPKARAQSVPWQRIVNREGGISTRGSGQRTLLEAEGVEFDERGRVRMDRHRWPGPDAAAEAQGLLPLPVHEEPEAHGQLSLF